MKTKVTAKSQPSVLEPGQRFYEASQPASSSWGRLSPASRKAYADIEARYEGSKTK